MCYRAKLRLILFSEIHSYNRTKDIQPQICLPIVQIWENCTS